MLFFGFSDSRSKAQLLLRHSKAQVGIRKCVRLNLQLCLKRIVSNNYQNFIDYFFTYVWARLFEQLDKPCYKRKKIQNDILVFIFIYALQNLMKLVHHLLDIKLVLGRLHVLSHFFITMQQSKIEEILASLNFFCVLMGQ